MSAGPIPTRVLGLLYGGGCAVILLTMGVGLARSLVGARQPPALEMSYSGEIDRLMRERDYQAALPLLRLAAEIDFGEEVRLWQTLEAAGHVGDLESQEFALRRLIRSQPENTDLYYWMAGVKLSQGDVDQAVRCAARAASLAPTRADVYCRYGAALLAADRKPEAAQQYRTALVLDATCEPARAALESPLQGY